ncbi:MAG: hypothetical protein RJA36_799 [Pseudomonadota bacterium]
MRTPELDARILEWISNGGTLRSICRQPGMPSHVTVHEWRKADATFAARYDEAKRIGYEHIGEEILDIANTPVDGEIVTEETTTAVDEAGDTVPAVRRTVRREDMLGHRKLQIEARDKLLKVWWPEGWTTKVAVEHSGKVSFDKMLQKVVDDEAADDPKEKGDGKPE